MDISIYNMMGTKTDYPGTWKLIRQEVIKQSGTQRHEKNKRIVPGIYYCKMVAGKKVFVKNNGCQLLILLIK